PYNNSTVVHRSSTGIRGGPQDGPTGPHPAPSRLNTCTTPHASLAQPTVDMRATRESPLADAGGDPPLVLGSDPPVYAPIHREQQHSGPDLLRPDLVDPDRLRSFVHRPDLRDRQAIGVGHGAFVELGVGRI